jgi:hypothetical protein
MSYPDYEEFLESLNAQGVRYLVVGGFAFSSHRIDLINSLASHLDFSEAWSRKVEAKFGNAPTYFLDLEDLIREKEKAGRPQDLVDLQALRRARGLRT